MPPQIADIAPRGGIPHFPLRAQWEIASYVQREGLAKTLEPVTKAIAQHVQRDFHSLGQGIRPALLARLGHLQTPQVWISVTSVRRAE